MGWMTSTPCLHMREIPVTPDLDMLGLHGSIAPQHITAALYWNEAGTCRSKGRLLRCAPDTAAAASSQFWTWWRMCSSSCAMISSLSEDDVLAGRAETEWGGPLGCSGGAPRQAAKLGRGALLGAIIAARQFGVGGPWRGDPPASSKGAWRGSTAETARPATIGADGMPCGAACSWAEASLADRLVSAADVLQCSTHIVM